MILEIQKAAERIEPYILKTPITRSEVLSQTQNGAGVYFKNEHLQYTGSFKLRGAMNKLLSLSSSQRRLGVIAASTGNHGMAVCYAAKTLGLRAQIVISSHASPMKLNGIRELGGEIVSVQGDSLCAELTARKLAQESGMSFISPYNENAIIHGQATLGLELSHQLPQVDAVFISVGGGGLIGGVGTYLKKFNPKITLVGCWAKNSPVLYESLQAGKILSVKEAPTLADALAGGLENETITLPLCQKVIDASALVTEDEIKTAIRWVAENERWMVEGGAAVALAGFLQMRSAFKGKNCAVVLCGRNISLDTFRNVFN